MMTTIRPKTLGTKLRRRLGRLLGRPHAQKKLDRTLKLGLIGLGGAAHWKLSEIATCPGATLHAVCDTRPEAIESVRRQCRVPHAFEDYRDLLELEDLDGVVISTPNALHYPVALAAFDAGKDVLCEKPLALNAGEARQMEQAARDSGCIAQVHFPYRLSAEAQFVRRLIAEGRLGRPYHLSITYAHGDWYDEAGSLRNAPGVGGWRTDRAMAGSGVLSDLGSHVLDLARHWLGEAEGMSATLLHQGEEGEDGIDDTASYRVRYQSGTLGTFVNSRCYTGHHQHFVAELYGSRAALRFGLEELHWFDRSSGHWIEVAVPEGFGRSMVTEFTDAILGKQTEAATFEDGLRVQELLDAAIESSECRQEVSLGPFVRSQDFALSLVR